MLKKEDLTIVKKLGKGKSGISYLAQSPQGLVVLKEMHDEKVPYYHFSKEKIELESDSHNILKGIQIRIPQLIHLERHGNYIIKEFIDGKTVTEELLEAPLADALILEMFRWEQRLKKESLNIDYFPSNFVVSHGALCYVDYEHNAYSEEWDFTHWGIYYWLNREGFIQFTQSGDDRHINRPLIGKPVISLAMEAERTRLLELFQEDQREA